MSKSQPAGQRPVSPASVPVPAEAAPVAPAEVQALLDSLASSSVHGEVTPVDPQLQSWFQGMLTFLPADQASNPATGREEAGTGNPPVVVPTAATPRPGRMEAWEIGGQTVATKRVNLDSIGPGPSPADQSRRDATPEDLERMISVPPPAPARVDTSSSRTSAAARSRQTSQRVSRERVPPKPSPAPTIVPPEPAAASLTSAEQEARDAELRDRVLLELRRVPALSQVAVQILVREGQVTLTGELRGDYERQLVAHFARQVRGVETVIDLTRSRTVESHPGPTGGRTTTSSVPAARKKIGPRRGAGASLSLPFRPAWILGVAGLFVLTWAGLSFGKRDPDRIEVHPAQGRVQFGEVVPDGALLTFHPLSPSLSIRPRATVRADGTFQVSTYGASDGAPEGDYRVTIVWHKLVEVDGETTAGPNLLPAPYSQPGSTELRVSVKPGTNELSPLQIRP